jgi:hypothetical protein
MATKYLTKKEVLATFRADILPVVIQGYGKDDKPAIREAWNNFTDMLCKEGQISSTQYSNWSNPF